MSTAVRDAVGHSSVILTVGAGGVGKTTIAAAIALRAALEGTSAVVLTIDPAKRLANALGLAEIGNTEVSVSESLFSAAGLRPSAPLSAMMLDMKRTWDELIERLAPPDKRDRILRNRFYQALSTALAGSQEYIALEKMWDLRNRHRAKLLVLDTPPTAHALDFLDAPSRVLDFLDTEAAKWLLTPALAAGKFGLRVFNLGSSYAAKTIARLTGTDMLRQLAEFMLALSSMNESFRERAHQTRALLEADRTSFLLVTGPMPERVDEAVYFHTLLLQNNLRVAGIVVNRVHGPVPPHLWDACRGLDGSLRASLERTLDEQEQLAAQDATGIARLRELCAPTPLVLVPHLDRDVHDLGALWTLSTYLWGDLSPTPTETHPS